MKKTGFIIEIQERVNGKVLYAHDTRNGGTLLRICRIPKCVGEREFTGMLDITLLPDGKATYSIKG